MILSSRPVTPELHEAISVSWYVDDVQQGQERMK